MARRPALKLDELKAQKTGTGKVEAAQAAGDRRRKGQTLRLPVAAWRQLKHLSVDCGKPAHALLVEAVNDLFKRHGKPPIA
jgi:hypothetical protein